MAFYVVTEKGSELLTKLNLTGKEDCKTADILRRASGEGSSLGEYNKKVIGKLLSEGLIEEDHVPLEDLTNEITGLYKPLGKVLTTYIRIAEERDVSDKELDRAISFLRRNISADLRESRPKLARKIRSILSSASSRSDKIIALDSCIAYIHDDYVLELEKKYKDEDKVDASREKVQDLTYRVLERLSSSTVEEVRYSDPYREVI